MKVAGTSLEIALSKYCDTGDILTPFGKKDEAKRRSMGFTPGQNHLVPLHRHTLRDWARLLVLRRRRRAFYSHDPAATVQQVVGPEIWNSYLKIAVVRNPYDYAISRYYWEKTRAAQPPAPTTLPDFGNWLIQSPEVLLENRRITHIDNHNAMDVMLRYERFDEDLTALSQRLSLPGNLAEDMATITAKTTSRPKNTTPAQMYRDHPDAKALIDLICAEDITTYGYTSP